MNFINSLIVNGFKLIHFNAIKVIIFVHFKKYFVFFLYSNDYCPKKRNHVYVF